MSLTPAEGGWRVAIVDGAEELNQSSANALLKILEEPPPRAILLLVCARARPAAADDPQPLPAPAPRPAGARRRWTGCWRSICRTCGADERGRLVTVAEGSPGRALLLAEEEGLAIAGLVDEVLAALPGLKPARAYAVADTLARGETAFTNFMDLLRAGIAAAVRDVVRGRADRGAVAAGCAASP